MFCIFVSAQHAASILRLGIGCKDIVRLCSQVARKVAKQIHQRGRENRLHSEPVRVVYRKCGNQETKMVLLRAIVPIFLQEGHGKVKNEKSLLGYSR